MRCFHLDEEAGIGQTVIITDSDARHMVRVLRLSRGQVASLKDAHGNRYSARIVSAEAQRVELEVLDKTPGISTGGTVRIDLAQGLLKAGKMDDLARFLTELGVRAWFPFFSMRTVPKPDRKKLSQRLARWERISKESIKQCGRESSLAIGPVLTFNELLYKISQYDLKILFWEGQAKAFGRIAEDIGGNSEILAIIGPEGGFDNAEAEALLDNGCICAGLGPRILRAETATVAVATLLQTLLGDMGIKNP